MSTTTRRKTMIASGRLTGTANRYRFTGTRCFVGKHLGEMMDREAMEHAGGHWATVATCSACGSTVDRAEFVGGVAIDDILRLAGSE